VANLYRLIAALLFAFVPLLSFADGGASFAAPGVWGPSSCSPSSYPYTDSNPAITGYRWGCQPAGNNMRECGYLLTAPAYGWSDRLNASSCYQSLGPGTCPAGATSSTGSSGETLCTCSAGYKENGFGDGCVQINHDREDCFNFSVSARMPGGDLVIDYRYSANVADGQKFCVGVEGMTNPGRGCTVTFNRTGLLDYGGGKIVSEGNLSMAADSNMVDQSCALNPSPPDSVKKPEPPEEKCKNGYSGQVNGITVCVNKVPDSGVGDETKETQSDDGTDTKKVKTEKNTTCTNGVCTTVTTVTTTTTNNASGVSNTTTQTSTTAEGKGTFCEENPSSKLCKDGEEDGSSFGGSCGAGFTCEGDAIQCAVAQEQHRRACKLFDDASEESELYQSNKGKEGNQTTNLPGNETINMAGRIDTSDALSAGSAGVSDLNVTVWGQSITLPFSMLNPYLAQLGNVLLAVSFLLALRIVARG